MQQRPGRYVLESSFGIQHILIEPFLSSFLSLVAPVTAAGTGSPAVDTGSPVGTGTGRIWITVTFYFE